MTPFHLSLHVNDLGGDSGTGVVAEAVPMPHFGVVMAMPQWLALAERTRAAGIAFVLEPQIRYAGSEREQGSFFVRDAADHALEFKAMRDPSQRFTPSAHA